jgi:hypothetical protein
MGKRLGRILRGRSRGWGIVQQAQGKFAFPKPLVHGGGKDPLAELGKPHEPSVSFLRVKFPGHLAE